MSKPTLLLGLLLLTAGAGGAWYFLQDDAVDATPDEGVSADAPVKTPVTDYVPLVQLEGEAPTEDRVAADTTEPATGDSNANFDTSDARWIDAVVVTPSGSPVDDSMRALALVWGDAEEESQGLRGRQTFGEILDYLQVEGNPTISWALCEIEDGRVRLPYAKDATRGFVMLDARYLFLPEGQKQIDLNGGITTVQLEPHLGGYLTGVAVIPAGADERGVSAANLECTVELNGFSMATGDESDVDWANMEVELGPDLAFEFRGLPTHLTYMLRSDAEDLVDFSKLGLGFEGGEHKTIELELGLGAWIKGRVTDEEGKALADVTVSTDSEGRSMFGGAERSRGETGSDGRYSLSGIPAGKTTVSASRDGYLTDESDELELEDAQVIDGIDFVLSEGDLVAGTVVWPDGNPVPYAEVAVSRKVNRDGDEWTSRLGTTTADEEGHFELRGLSGAPYTITAKARPGGEPIEHGHGEPLPGLGHTSVVSVEGAITDSASIEPDWMGRTEGVAANVGDAVVTLLEPKGFPGVLVDDLGEPVKSFTIRANSESDRNRWGSNQAASDSFVNDKGEFFLDGLYEGDFTVVPSAVGYSISGEHPTITIPYEGDPLRLTVVRAANVSGIVIDAAGLPVEGAHVSLDTDGEQNWAVIQYQIGNDDSGDTDAEGKWRLENVSAGTHSASAAHEDAAPSEPVAFELEAGVDLEGIVIQLKAGGTITGEVFDEEGRPQAGRSVTYGRGGMGMGFMGGGPGTTTDASGKFRIEHVPAGQQVVTASPSQEAIMEVMANAQDELAFVELMSQTVTEKVMVVDGEEVHVILGPEPKEPVRVYGTVEKRGEAISEAMVFAIEEGNSIMEGLKMTRSDSDGQYELTLDRPGSYVLGIQRSEAGGPEVEFLVDVPEQAEFQIDLSVPLAALSGRILAPDGSPAEGVTVRLTRSNTRLSITDMNGGKSQESDEDGYFTYDELWAGTYTLRAGGMGRWGEGGAYGVSIVSDVDVDEDELTEGIVIQLAKAGSISGVVKDSDGNPVANASVFVRDSAGRLVSRMSTTATDALGRFEYKGLSPGAYTLSARTTNAASGETGPVTVREGEAAEASLTIESATMLIVRVVDGDGNAQSASITVTDSAGREVSQMVAGDFMESAFVDGIDSKVERVGPLPPGKYRVQATTRDGRKSTKPVTLKGQKERELKMRLRD